MSPLARRAEPLAAAAFGAVQTLAYVVTWAWLLVPLAIGWLVWRLDRAPRVRRAALLGWAFGSGWLAAGVWWLFVSMHRYGHLPAPLAVAAVAALAAALSAYLALAAALYRRLRQGRPLADAAVFAALWLLAELARGLLFTGFPWLSSGYSQVDGPLAALAPLVGVYGIGAVLAGLGALLAQAAARRWWPGLLLPALALLAGGLAGPPDYSRPGATLTVQLLQTHVAQDEKFAADRMPETLQWVADALQAADAELVVAPETAVPLLPDQLEELVPGYWARLRERFARPGQAALVGVPLGSFEQGYTNSVAGLSRAAAARPGGQYRYDKVHLVPFGEFVPRGFRWFTELMNIPLGDFNRGVPNPPSFVVGGERAAPNICYEDLFGEELALRFADPAASPTLLVNVGNIGWFGDTVAVVQHLNISRLRALEFQRPMLRATNTGATAIIDHRGRVDGLLPPFTRGVLAGRVQARHGHTPYADWAARFGLWPLLAAALALLAAAQGPRLWGRRGAGSAG